MAISKKTTKVQTPIDERETFVSLQKTFAESEQSVQEKLKTLYQLQLIDNDIDKLVQFRGELPKEVAALEQEVSELKAKYAKVEQLIEAYNQTIEAAKVSIVEYEEEIAKYSAQLENISNRLYEEYELTRRDAEELNIVIEDVKVEPQNLNVNTVPVGFYQEQELVKLLLMYGDTEIDFDSVDENNNPIIYKISVASLIIDDLKNDDLLFSDETHRMIFDIFDRALDEGVLPKEQFFVSHENIRIAELAANLLSSPYKLDNWEKKEIKVKKEEDVLSKMVVTSLLRFKDMVIDEKRNDLTREIMENQNIDDQFALLVKKKKLDDLRMKINKELGIVIAK